MPTPRVLILTFDPERLRTQVRVDRWDYVFYHLRRILTAEGSAPDSLEYYGITWTVEEDCDQGGE